MISVSFNFRYDVPYVYLIDNAIELGFGKTESSYLVSVIGILNMLGEVSTLFCLLCKFVEFHSSITPFFFCRKAECEIHSTCV